MIIGFHTSQLDLRGTCVSLYDYAYYNEKLLSNKSYIFIPEDSEYIEPRVLKKFREQFTILFYRNIEHLNYLAHMVKLNIFYCIKYGKPDDIVVQGVKNVIHCVFDLSTPHGDMYAGVSATLAKKFKWPHYVPHMIGLEPSTTNENMREELNIPSNAVVFGRHGGRDTFDLEIAKRSIMKLVNSREDVYFIFVNTPMFYKHDRVIHLDKLVTSAEKNKFICTCDVMIHAQSLGETFGLSVGEFSVNNKPIITYGGKVWNDHYKQILGDKALYYYTEDECYDKMNSFDPEHYVTLDNNCYKQYSPDKVMKIFEDVFIHKTL